MSSKSKRCTTQTKRKEGKGEEWTQTVVADNGTNTNNDTHTHTYRAVHTLELEHVIVRILRDPSKNKSLYLWRSREGREGRRGEGWFDEKTRRQHWPSTKTEIVLLCSPEVTLSFSKGHEWFMSTSPLPPEYTECISLEVSILWYRTHPPGLVKSRTGSDGRRFTGDLIKLKNRFHARSKELDGWRANVLFSQYILLEFFLILVLVGY